MEIYISSLQKIFVCLDRFHKAKIDALKISLEIIPNMEPARLLCIAQGLMLFCLICSLGQTVALMTLAAQLSKISKSNCAYKPA